MVISIIIVFLCFVQLKVYFIRAILQNDLSDIRDVILPLFILYFADDLSPIQSQTKNKLTFLTSIEFEYPPRTQF